MQLSFQPPQGCFTMQTLSQVVKDFLFSKRDPRIKSNSWLFIKIVSFYRWHCGTARIQPAKRTLALKRSPRKDQDSRVFELTPTETVRETKRALAANE